MERCLADSSHILFQDFVFKITKHIIHVTVCLHTTSTIEVRARVFRLTAGIWSFNFPDASGHFSD